MQALESLFYAQFTLSTQLIKPKYPVIPFPPLPPKQQHSFLGTWPLNLFLITLSLNFSLGDLTTPQLSFCLEQI